MTLASDIVTYAFREANIIPIGSAPTTAEMTEGLRRFNRIVQGVMGTELGEPLVDWPVPQPQRTAPVAANAPQLPWPMSLGTELYGPTSVPGLGGAFSLYPPKNSRLIFGGVANTAYFPEQPDDGSRMMVVQGSGAGDSGVAGAVLTLNGNGRTIQKAATQTFTFAALPTPTAAKTWLYSASAGDWMAVGDLVAGDTVPFPEEIDDFWICRLAARIAPSYGKTLSDDTKTTDARMTLKVKTMFRQSGTTIYNIDVPNSWQTYNSGYWNWY